MNGNYIVNYLLAFLAAFVVSAAAWADDLNSKVVHRQN